MLTLPKCGKCDYQWCCMTERRLAIESIAKVAMGFYVQGDYSGGPGDYAPNLMDGYIDVTIECPDYVNFKERRECKKWIQHEEYYQGHLEKVTFECPECGLETDGCPSRCPDCGIELTY